MASPPYPYGITVAELVALILLARVRPHLQNADLPFRRSDSVHTEADPLAYVCTGCRPKQHSTLAAMGLTRVTVTYKRFMHSNSGKNLPIVNEDVGEGASLHWIGLKENEWAAATSFPPCTAPS